MTRDGKILYNVGYVLRKLRLKKDKLQNDISAACDFNPGSYSRMESGLRDLKISDIFALAEYYGIAPGMLVDMIEVCSIDLPKQEESI